PLQRLVLSVDHYSTRRDACLPGAGRNRGDRARRGDPSLRRAGRHEHAAQRRAGTEALARPADREDDGRRCTPCRGDRGDGGARLSHHPVYGLTEVYGPAVVCAWHDEWDELPAAERARLKARQGVTYPVLEGLTVADPETFAPMPPDGTTMGEVLMRGNIVMKGYLKNPTATVEAFAGGWFRSGDLGVTHADGYIE